MFGELKRLYFYCFTFSTLNITLFNEKNSAISGCFSVLFRI
jgi:hypothetical protein